MASLYQVPTENALQYQLDSAYTAGSGSFTLNSSVTGIVQAPGVGVINRVDSSGNVTPTKRNYFTFTGVSGAQLTGVAGGLAGSTDQDALVGSIVEFIPDITWAQALYDVITTEHNATGKHTAITASSASIAKGAIHEFISASLASLNQVGIDKLTVGTHIAASGASITGFPPPSYISMASGNVLTLYDGTNAGWKPPTATSGGTGGFNALFQVPGNLPSTATDIMGAIPIPTAFTAQYMNAILRTPCSVASMQIMIKKLPATTVGIVSMLAGATFASSASLAVTALSAGDVLIGDIVHASHVASDLSLVIRAV